MTKKRATCTKCGRKRNTRHMIRYTVWECRDCTETVKGDAKYDPGYRPDPSQLDMFKDRSA